MEPTEYVIKPKPRDKTKKPFPPFRLISPRNIATVTESGLTQQDGGDAAVACPNFLFDAGGGGEDGFLIHRFQDGGMINHKR